MYSLLGAGDAAWKHWEACDIKQIQLDTIAYILTDHLALAGAPACQEQIYSQAQTFFKYANKEMFEYIIKAYKDGSFGKIREFQEFQDKIKWSTTFATIACESEHFLVLDQISEWYVTASLPLFQNGRQKIVI